MLEHTTPLILTYNEAPNIGRTLEQLRWARDIVVVDSFSTDETLAIVTRFPQARVFQRAFDGHENQWNFGLKETGIASEWVLALDADYVLTSGLVAELAALTPAAAVAGYRANFVYCIYGRPLRGSAYPPVTVLYRRAGAVYRQDGHTQRVLLAGPVAGLHSPIRHDDRKSLSHWVRAQERYLKLEAGKLLGHDSGSLRWADRLRLMRFPAPFVMLLYCLFSKGAILDGRAGFYYAFQRMFAELLLLLNLLEHDVMQFGRKHNEQPEGDKNCQTDFVSAKQKN